MTDFLLVLIFLTILVMGIEINNSIKGKPQSHLDTFLGLVVVSLVLYLIFLGFQNVSQNVIEFLTEIWEKR